MPVTARSGQDKTPNMIPITLTSPLFYVLLLLSAISALVLLFWLVLLGVRRGTRKAFRARLWFALPLLILLALSSTFILSFLYRAHLVDADIKRDEAARNIVLDKPLVVAGIAMPAGTRLHSMKPGGPEAFDAASFPVPTLIQGVTAVSVRRHVYPDIDSNTYVATSMEVTLASDQRIDGWLCEKAVSVTFNVKADKIFFDACALGAGHHLADIEVPVGAKLLAHASPSGGWTIFLTPGTTVTVRGLPLQGARIAVDRNRQVVGFSEAVLAAGLRLGAVTYPAGIRIRSKDWTSPGRDSDSLILSPVRGLVAKPDGQPDVPFGRSIVQTMTGQVLAIMPNQQAGVMDFEDVSVGGRLN
ncbi:hypothetical protein KK141_11305 [Dyella sp. LX-66]|uniref:hypothetical protein n=1 Tax=unclassified Dyella TaxID=2634549 RepID=UPI001BDFA947|nr:MULTISPECIES: hypothetical protein [unclassified Dyella]MBT2118890.1 hypothetical protein [Dyella sp. LX-1]MBT2140117.1 hypothetical protein [Dyella sp. LX-66]